MNGLLGVLLSISLFIIFITISSGIFMGAGYIISLLTELNLFQASLLSIGATFVSGFILNALMKPDVPFFNRKYDGFETKEDADYDLGMEAVEDDSTTESIISSPIVNSQKIGRNQLCPCGSGKKYKHCCYVNKVDHEK